MRPLDQKLKYQIDKLVRTAVTGSLGKIVTQQLCFLWLKWVYIVYAVCEATYSDPTLHYFSAKNDPLHFRPNPDNLVSKVSDLTFTFEQNSSE